jgi:hypothetical protein
VSWEAQLSRVQMLTVQTIQFLATSHRQKPARSDVALHPYVSSRVWLPKSRACYRASMSAQAESGSREIRYLEGRAKDRVISP